MIREVLQYPYLQPTANEQRVATWTLSSVDPFSLQGPTIHGPPIVLELLMPCSAWWSKQILLEPLLNSWREWMGSFSLCVFSGIASKWFLATLLWCYFIYKPDIWFLGDFSYSYSVGSHPKSTLRDALHVLPYPQPQTDCYFRSTLFLLCHFMPLQHPPCPILLLLSSLLTCVVLLLNFFLYILSAKFLLVDQWLSKCGPWDRRISIMGELPNQKHWVKAQQAVF